MARPPARGILVADISKAAPVYSPICHIAVITVAINAIRGIVGGAHELTFRLVRTVMGDRGVHRAAASGKPHGVGFITIVHAIVVAIRAIGIIVRGSVHIRAISIT